MTSVVVGTSVKLSHLAGFFNAEPTVLIERCDLITRMRERALHRLCFSFFVTPLQIDRYRRRWLNTVRTETHAWSMSERHTGHRFQPAVDISTQPSFRLVAECVRKELLITTNTEQIGLTVSLQLITDTGVEKLGSWRSSLFSSER